MARTRKDASPRPVQGGGRGDALSQRQRGPVKGSTHRVTRVHVNGCLASRIARSKPLHPFTRARTPHPNIATPHPTVATHTTPIHSQPFPCADCGAGRSGHRLCVACPARPATGGANIR